MSEIWKDVVGYEGLYEVSNMGRVRSLPKVLDYVTRWGTPSKRKFPGHILAPKKGTNGYLLQCYAHGGEKKYMMTHRVVAQAFVDNPENKAEVNHKNGDRHDNRAENLEWATRSENIIHSIEELGTHHGERTGAAKIANDDIPDIRFLLANNVPHPKIAELYGVTAGAISAINVGTTWARVA